jgi:Family of unknown function (DUF6459)
MPQPESRTAPLLRSSLTRTIRARPGPTAVQGTLALQWQLPGDLDAVPLAPASLRLVSRGTSDPDLDPAVAHVPTARHELPDPGPWTTQLVQAVLEVLAQERPRQQLVRWLTPAVYAELSTQVLAAPRRAQTAVRSRATVSSVHLFEPADGVVEASAVVTGGRRARALALRLEGWDGRWRCTMLALL